MTINQIQKLLIELRDKGFIKSLRKSDTGIGHTLEQLLKLKENNLSIPDLGGTVELKTTRQNSKTLITLFCFNKLVWQINQRDAILKYGYYDKENKRRALYNTVKVNEVNSQGLTLVTDFSNHTINLLHKSRNELIAVWSVYNIVGKFLNKLGRLLFVVAETKELNGVEYFHYTNANILSDPTPEKFLDAFQKGYVCIDLRLHLKSNNTVRNRGTGFRVIEDKLPSLYGKIKKLM